MIGYIIFGLIGLVLAVVATPLVRKLAIKYQFIDIPRPPRNLHTNAVPKLGGVAVYIAFALAILLYMYFGDPDLIRVPEKFIFGMLLGGLVLIIGGIIDDKYDLPAKYLWIAPVVSALIVVMSGIGVGITTISNPFGAPIDISFKVLGVSASAIFIFIWMLGMMFTTKFLDGLDGLVAGIGLIAGLTLFTLSLADHINQPTTASFAIILVGSLAGYLIFAFHPAKIFLGEGGSLLIGFILGVLSVILGGKIATALLVMGIPILDVAWVIAQRIYYRKSPFIGDRLHLHFRLIDLGLTQRQTALILYLISIIFGFTAVFLQSMGKLVALIILAAVMTGFVLAILYAYKRRQQTLDLPTT